MEFTRYKLIGLRFYNWVSLCYILSLVLTFPICCSLGVLGFFEVDIFISDGSYIHGPRALISGMLSGIFLPLPLSFPFSILSYLGLKILLYLNVKISFEAILSED